MRCVEHEISEGFFVDMHWSISKSKGVIKLNNLIPLDVLYLADHNAGVVGGIWLEHHKEFVRFISKFNPKSVLEIGGAHGILSREIKKLSKII